MKKKKPYVIARASKAGVFAGHLKSFKKKRVVLLNARRIWYWEGAATLSQLAQEGTSKPDGCKFPCAVNKVVLTEVIELLSCTEAAQASIEGVKIWRQ